MSNKIDTDNFWNAFHESVGPSTSEALDNDTKKLGIPAVRFITEDWKNLIEEIRQEERHEYAKEVRAFMNGSLEVAKESEIQRAKQEARREALKEMDEAHHMIFGKPYSECAELQKLRQEYQQPN